MTPAEYKELIKKDTIKIGEDLEMTDSVTELFNELVEDGHDADDLQAFIDAHGKSNFMDYIEEYLQTVDEYNEEVVESFLEIFNIEDIGNLSESYQGQYDSGADFAEQICQDCGYISNNTPHWIVIDWERTWQANLRHDYIELGEGHIFSAN